MGRVEQGRGRKDRFVTPPLRDGPHEINITGAFELIYRNTSNAKASNVAEHLLRKHEDWLEEHEVIRIIERRQEAAADEDVYEFRIFRARDGSVRGCAAASLDTGAAPREHVAQSYLDALSLCDMIGISVFWVHDPLGLFPPSDRPIGASSEPDDDEASPASRAPRSHGFATRTRGANFAAPARSSASGKSRRGSA